MLLKSSLSLDYIQTVITGGKGLGCPSDGKQDKEDTSIGGKDFLEEVMKAHEKELEFQQNGVELREKGAELQEKEVVSTAKEKDLNPLEERLDPCKKDGKSQEGETEAKEKGSELLVKGVESQKKEEESRRAEQPRNGEASPESGLQVPESEGISLDRDIKRRDGALMSKGGEVDRYYVLGQQMNREEDLCHEFKGHRSISIHDLHNLCLNTDGTTDRSRNAVSMYV